MKRLSLFFTIALVLLSTNTFAQTASFVRERIEEIVSRFHENPGGAYDTLFTSAFLAQIPESKLNPLFIQYAKDYGTVSRWYYTDSSQTARAAAKLVMSNGYTVDMHIAVEEEDKHLIKGLVIGMGTPLATSLDEVMTKFKALPGTVGFLAARLRGTKIEPIAALNVDTALALGSAFKLYVLAELVHEIEQGKRHWRDVIVLDSASRSLPSGMMHEWPAGTPITLQAAATLMISISDNTATDLLIHTFGRTNIEQMVARAHNSHVALDVPFLTTLEDFKLKANDKRLGMAYIRMSRAARRRYLAKTVAEFPRDSVATVGSPAMNRDIEWFASPRDIANVFVWLLTHSERGPGMRAREILSINPILPLDKKRWKYIGAKGGSEPGVIDVSYLLQSSKGDWYVLTGTWNDPEKEVDETKFEGYITRAAELLP